MSDVNLSKGFSENYKISEKVPLTMDNDSDDMTHTASTLTLILTSVAMENPCED